MGRPELAQVRPKLGIKTLQQAPPPAERRHRGSAARQRQQRTSRIQCGGRRRPKKAAGLGFGRNPDEAFKGPSSLAKGPPRNE